MARRSPATAVSIEKCGVEKEEVVVVEESKAELKVVSALVAPPSPSVDSLSNLFAELSLASSVPPRPARIPVPLPIVTPIAHTVPKLPSSIRTRRPPSIAVPKTLSAPTLPAATLIRRRSIPTSSFVPLRRMPTTPEPRELYHDSHPSSRVENRRASMPVVGTRLLPAFALPSPGFPVASLAFPGQRGAAEVEKRRACGRETMGRLSLEWPRVGFALDAVAVKVKEQLVIMTGTEAYRRVPPSLNSKISNSRARQQTAPDGFRIKTARGALITASLPSLQNLIKRSPDSYAEEFAVQWARFGSQVRIVQLGLGGSKGDEDSLREVTGFVCQVAHLYPTLTSSLPTTLSSLLLSSAPAAPSASLHPSSTAGGASAGISGGGVQLGPETRKTMMQGLVLLRRRDVITGVDLLKTLFPLLSMTTSPNLRSFILKTILGDIKNANIKVKNHKLNRMVQGLLFGMIERGIDAEAERLGTGVKPSRRGDVKIVGAREAMWAVKIAAELWRKNVWRDAKTVAIVASACFHPDTKVQSAAIHFFLVTPEAGKDEDEDSSDEDNEGPDIKTVKHRVDINKKKKSTERKARKDIKNANVKRRQREIAAKEPSVNFSALQLLNDPQTFGEKLYQSLVKYDRSYTLDHKVLIMSLFGRVCGSHKLTVLSFYSYIVKYLTHHQLQITAILVCLAQSVHDLTPPDELTPVIKKISGEFVHGGVAAEVIAAGLNAIREICRRQPWCMERELLEDLVEYRMSKDKGVMVASRSLLQLYREVNPGLLKRRDMGKLAAMADKDAEPLQYGESRDAATSIEGLDLLAKHLAEVEANGEVDEDGEWKAWEVESDSDSDSSGGWNDVPSDGSDIELTDSEDEGKAKSRKKRKVVPVVEEEKVVEEIVEEEDDKDSDADSEEDDDEDEDEVKNDPILRATAVTNDEDEDEMSLARANKELKGTAFADLATTKILTPADFAKINELRTAAAEEEAKNGGGGAARRKLAALSAARKANTGESDNFLTEGEIIGVQKKAKNSYEERLAMIAEGREGREKFGSLRHKKLSEKEHSTTNEEKRKKKAFAMVAASRSVRRKNTSSLQQKSKALRSHIDRIKKGGRRGNSG